MPHGARTPMQETHRQAAWLMPGVLPDLGRGHELFQHVAAYDAYLQALPRRVRRALQRR